MNEPCKHYIFPTYATCGICKLECKYTSCYGNKKNCRYQTKKEKLDMRAYKDREASK